MKTLNEINADVEKIIQSRNEIKVTKMKALYLCIKECLEEIITDDDRAVLKDILGETSTIYINHETNRSNISSIGIRFRVEDNNELHVSLKAHDAYYDPYIVLGSFDHLDNNSNLELILNFYSNHKNEFVDWLITGGTLDLHGNVVNEDFCVQEIVDGINESLYKSILRYQMNQLCWDKEQFDKSDYAFHISDDDMKAIKAKCSKIVKERLAE